MQPMQWSIQKIKQCEEETGQALLSDKSTLAVFNHDFSGLVSGEATAVFKPRNLTALQRFLNFSHRHKLPLTIRANGLSQSGQSLAPKGAISVDISQLNPVVQWQGDELTAGCSASFNDIAVKSLERNKLPQVYPYNMNLTAGGVLSVGGIGSSTFKKGVVSAHIDALNVITAAGELLACSPHNHKDLFDAALAGAGLFGIIYNAKIKLRTCKPHVTTYTLLYDDYTSWIADQFQLKSYCDYLEAFITVQNKEKKKFTCHTIIGIEHDNEPVDATFLNMLRHRQVAESSTKTLSEYMHRHDRRLNLMKETGNWQELHPWYECYIDSNLLMANLNKILEILSPDLGDLYHIFPVAPIKPPYFMLPNQEKIVTFNVLTPGLKKENAEKAIKSILKVDEILLRLGGKRYISGWFNATKDGGYWARHYEDYLQERQNTKAKYDPHHIFRSCLFPE
ncbi:FAD-binding protein [Legionella septentrionalis]|uniref:FAD-binding protein n=1 Tax=Legionella septentrionalis TaxID=2498109 RepID=UPI000F8D5954|nr:FAD-binding protein [Legionella septentrionalis]RUQ97493.1 FAD-binding protein [Legionella septentrionalis]RUR09789.1 FAD-binding protein [Legionella septentrionalis]RUR15919.1 FAD-binding protein [Legionella septentrionalis]